MISIALLVILILILLGVLPTWQYSAKWGYGPSAGVGLLALVIVALLILGIVA